MLTIRCEQAHRLELRIFLFVLRIHQCSERNKDEIYFWTCMFKMRNTGITDKWIFRHTFIICYVVYLKFRLVNQITNDRR